MAMVGGRGERVDFSLDEMANLLIKTDRRPYKIPDFHRGVKFSHRMSKEIV